MRHIDIRAIEPPPVIGRLEEYNPGDTITLYFRCRDDDDRGESGVISKRMCLLSKHKHHAVFKNPGGTTESLRYWEIYKRMDRRNFEQQEGA